MGALAEREREAIGLDRPSDGRIEALIGDPGRVGRGQLREDVDIDRTPARFRYRLVFDAVEVCVCAAFRLSVAAKT